MRRLGTTITLAALAAAAIVFGAQCGARTGLLVPERGDGGDGDSTADARDARDERREGAVVDLCEDAGDAAASGDACENLACQIPDCGLGASTSLSAKVYDPSGSRPLYNALVYVPNRPLEPIPSGPVCAVCQAPASGRPIVRGVTDTSGNVTLDGVPAGSSVPIVMQVGKWRRKIEVPIKACVANVFDDKDTFRLPRAQSEGDIPLIAFATGCDEAQCFLTRTLGLSPSEITAPGGGGRVHVYKSPHTGDPGIPGALGNPYDLWGDLDAMMRYDMLFNACECSPYARTTDAKKPAYANMKKYLDAGGRMFGTHYHWNWFAEPDGPADFQKQAGWLANLSQVTVPPPPRGDTSHPRGKAFADWLQSNAISSIYGQVNLVDTRASVAGLNGGMPGHGTYTNTTQWIYHANDFTMYLSFNTPTKNGAGQQCGRAVFSDVHLSGTFPHQTPFPQYCPQKSNVNELALEFLFFDLASCVQDDTKPPARPCEK